MRYVLSVLLVLCLAVSGCGLARGPAQKSTASAAVGEGAQVGEIDQAPRQAGVESESIGGDVSTAVFGLDPGLIDVLTRSLLPMTGKGIGAGLVFVFGLFVAMAFARSIAPNVFVEVIGVSVGVLVALLGPFVLWTLL